MAFDFPSNPAVDSVFTDTATGATYYWTGYAWSRNAEKALTHPPASTVPLEPPIDGETTVQGSLQKMSVEVDALAAETGNKVDVAGDTMTGALILSEHPTALSPALQAATRSYVDNIGAGLPVGGTQGQALVINALGAPAWGAPMEGGNF